MSDQQTDKKTYKKTLNLPRTAFPMKANLVQNEPATLKRWQKEDLYNKIRQARKQHHPKGDYIFHDGPPYANGSRGRRPHGVCRRSERSDRCLGQRIRQRRRLDDAWRSEGHTDQR